MSLVKISRELRRRVDALDARTATPFVYNPLDYARKPHELYLTTWGGSPKRVLLVGMNPGPFGMAQTGVPFGDVAMVRDFLGIEAPVGRPRSECPQRPVEGFRCRRSEVSGTRLWGFARDTFGAPEAFFRDYFVVNYCPLVFMTESGKNVTPDKLEAAATAPLFSACDDALRATVQELRPEWVIGVGGFAEKRARKTLGDAGPKIGAILHPSPASPAANRGWAPQVRQQLAALGLL